VGLDSGRVLGNLDVPTNVKSSNPAVVLVCVTVGSRQSSNLLAAMAKASYSIKQIEFAGNVLTLVN
jgi:hypothetical protein